MKYKINPKYSSLKPLIENIDDFFNDSAHVLYDQRNVIRVVDYEGQKYVVKAFKVPNIINRFVYQYIRPSKARRSYDYSLKLGNNLSPEPIAYIEEVKSGLLTTSYYISDFFDYDYTIHEVLIQKTLIERELMLREFAQFTFDLHESKILHHDYSHGNILIKKTDKELGRYKIKIIDVNRMEFTSLDLKTRLGNFARINADDADMEIIIKQYAALSNQPIDKLLEDAKSYRDDFYKKRDFKNKIRGKSR